MNNNSQPEIAEATSTEITDDFIEQLPAMRAKIGRDLCDSIEEQEKELLLRGYYKAKGN